MRDPKTKSPQVSFERRAEQSYDESVRQNDSESKRKMKENMDRRNNAQHRDINVGDSVIVKYDQRGNKLQPIYKPELKTVLAKKGSMLTISGNITRNMSQVKKVNPKLEIAPPEDANEIEVAWPQTSNAGSPSESESVPQDLVSEKPRVVVVKEQ
jgi:hypothetical protein